jgi:hypothetical protein
MSVPMKNDSPDEVVYDSPVDVVDDRNAPPYSARKFFYHFKKGMAFVDDMPTLD